MLRLTKAYAPAKQGIRRRLASTGIGSCDLGAVAGYVGGMLSLSDYLDLTVEQARSQWGQILRRQPRPRQEQFTPVEAILCYGLFQIVDDPHRYGSASIRNAPPLVHELAALFVRPPTSITHKMMNLAGGARSRGGRSEPEFYARMRSNPDRFTHLYNLVLSAARDMAVGPDQMPDFLALEGFDYATLLGQEELLHADLSRVVTSLAAQQRTYRLGDPVDTERMIEKKVRIGQHKFAAEVMENFGFSCGFCGFAPRSIGGNRLLVASHIKPWAACDDRERVDHLNGVAACPTHDAAFDSGLLTVNGGLRVHRAPKLEASNRSDPGVDQYFGQSLKPKLIVPKRGQRPGDSYLEWHQEHVFQGVVAI